MSTLDKFVSEAGHIAMRPDTIESLRADLTAAREEVAELTPDAERWRHVEKFGVPSWDRGNRCYVIYDGDTPKFFGTLKEAVDQLIDQARTALEAK